MKLNLGCGEKMRDETGWLNVDIRKLTPEFAEYLRHDIRAIREIVEDGTIEEVALIDVLEHFGKVEAEKLVADVAAILRPGGLLTLKTPVIALLIKWANNPRHDELNTALRWFGGNDYPENCHRFVWPERELRALLERNRLRIASQQYAEDTNILLECRKEG